MLKIIPDSISKKAPWGEKKFFNLERNCIIVHWSKEDFEMYPEKDIHLLYTAFTRALNKVYIVLTKKENEAKFYN